MSVTLLVPWDILIFSLKNFSLEHEGKLPSFYWRYVDDTLTIMLNIETASNFLDTLNNKGTFLRKIHNGNRMQWHAPISEHPVTE